MTPRYAVFLAVVGSLTACAELASPPPSEAWRRPKLVRDVETSPAAQERAAREEFGMIRDGEVLYRLVPERP